MKKKIFKNIVIISLSMSLATGCSNTPETDPASVATKYAEETVTTSVTDDTTATDATDTTASPGDTTTTDTSTEATTTGETTTTVTGEEAQTTTPVSTNKPAETTTKAPSKDSDKNNQSNHNSTESTDSTGDSDVVGEKDYDKITYDSGSISYATEVTKLAQAVVDKIIKKGMSDFEKAKAIHDYMVMNIDYDYDDYLAGTIPYESYEVIGALKNKYAVCAGYAKTFKLLCNLSGLECTYVTGKARGYHAWNQVKIDGKWYNVDVTWDDPVSTDKAFDNHRFNRYSYFLISDELMYKDHEAQSTVKKCSSSLHMKAYEVGAPWASTTYTYIKDDSSLNTVLKKVIDNNAASVNIMWDTNWISHLDMTDKMKSLMLEYNIVDDFRFGGYSYGTIPNTSLCRACFEIKLKDSKYTTYNTLTSADEVKAIIKKMKSGDSKDVYMTNKLAETDSLYPIALWAYKELNMTVGFSKNKDANSKAKYMHVYASSHSDDSPYDAYYDATYRVETIAETTKALEEFFPTDGYRIRIIYRYGDELGRLSESEIISYMENTMAPKWNSEYCYTYKTLGCNDFLCTISFEIYHGSHSTDSWVTAKEATCTKDGLKTLSCTKCKRIIQSYTIPATGVHDTYWVYDNDTTRHQGCKNCSYTGTNIYKYGDVWGYYDDKAASDFFKAINKERETATYYDIDPWGNLIGVETPPQLTLDDSLSEYLREYVLDMAKQLIDKKGVESKEYIIWWDRGTNVDYICNDLFMRGYARDCLENKYLTKAGVTCFYYDSDGTGNKMVPIWCVYFAE